MVWVSPGKACKNVRVCAHEINFHEINSRVINSNKNNSLWSQLERDQLKSTRYFVIDTLDYSYSQQLTHQYHQMTCLIGPLISTCQRPKVDMHWYVIQWPVDLFDRHWVVSFSLFKPRILSTMHTHLHLLQWLSSLIPTEEERSCISRGMSTLR